MGPQPMGLDCPAVPQGGDLPIVCWDGARPSALIAALETRLASGTQFAVLSSAPHLGRGTDVALLAHWWSTRIDRLAGLCVGWVVLVPGADVNPALLSRHGAQDSGLPFPVRPCADRADALVWLNTRLNQAGTASPHGAEPR